MLEMLFGWRKASKCKKVMNNLKRRLKVLRSNLDAAVKQLRDEIGLLLRNGHNHIAYSKIEKLYMGENRKQVYELLDNYCGFVLMNLSSIKKHRKCPSDLNKAVSSLIFASVRMQELPELKELGMLFKERYGYEFASTATDLLPGNLVNSQLKSKVCIKTVPKDAKERLFDEIIRNSLEPEGFFVIECKPQAPQLMAPESEEALDAMKCPEIRHGYDRITSTVVPQSSPSIISDAFLINEDHDDTFSFPNACCQDECLADKKLVHIDDIAEDSKSKSDRKRPRRRSSSTVKENELEAMSLARGVYEKVADGFAASFRLWLKEEETEKSGNSSNSTHKIVEVGLSSPSCVHPNYDELEALFEALKNKIISTASL